MASLIRNVLRLRKGIVNRLQLARILNFVDKNNHWKNMDNINILDPPAIVRGMQELERHAFCKTINVPCLRVNNKEANVVLPLLKKYLLKVDKLRPVREINSTTTTTNESDAKATIEKEILLNPVSVLAWHSLPTEQLLKVEVTDQAFYFSPLELNYDNWRIDEIFKSVLPQDREGLTSYSRIGHIVHLNLREHLIPYKNLIGQVLLEKVSSCRTVVNKTAMIDNTYRNFELELICGESDYLAEVKENGTTYEFDFSKVYWNPRLCTEHKRIVDLLDSGDVVYDVFAGVGPFCIPAAKKRCSVLANDLNPESFRWLLHNAKRNKCSKEMQLFNKDGCEFITHEVKTDLLKRWSETVTGSSSYNTHIIMNLPATAVEFLNVFKGLVKNEANEIQFPNTLNFPIVHVYCFAKGVFTEIEAQLLIEQHLGQTIENIEGVYFVRNVAPNKDMYRISFKLTKDILTSNDQDLKKCNRKRCASPPDIEQMEILHKNKC